MATEDFDLDSFIPYRLNRASKFVSWTFSEVYTGEFGITRPEWRVLANLGQHGRQQKKLTAKKICALSTQHKTKVSRAVSSLEKRGWLKREPNPEDRREEWLELTAAGIAAYDKIAEEGYTYDKRLLDQLGSTKAKALLTALDALDALRKAHDQTVSRSD